MIFDKPLPAWHGQVTLGHQVRTTARPPPSPNDCCSFENCKSKNLQKFFGIACNKDYEASSLMCGQYSMWDQIQSNKFLSLKNEPLYCCLFMRILLVCQFYPTNKTENLSKDTLDQSENYVKCKIVQNAEQCSYTSSKCYIIHLSCHGH